MPSPPAVASSLPSGLNATAFTPASSDRCSRERSADGPLRSAGFHSRTVPSSPAVARSLPSGLNATPITAARGVSR